jgi:hypothetical protein
VHVNMTVVVPALGLIVDFDDKLDSVSYAVQCVQVLFVDTYLFLSSMYLFLALHFFLVTCIISVWKLG